MATSLEIINAANLQFLLNTPQLQVAQTSAQSLGNSVFTAVTWPSPTVDNYSGWASGTPTRYTPKVAGTYLVVGSIAFAPNATGGRTAQLCKNGVANVIAVSSVGNSTSSFNTVVQVTSFMVCNGTTDYFELYADQNSGGALNSVVTITSLNVQWIHT